MASGQTEHYGLNQWQPEDQVLREEFNGDNAKLDAALWTIPIVKLGQWELPAEGSAFTADLRGMELRPYAGLRLRVWAPTEGESVRVTLNDADLYYSGSSKFTTLSLFSHRGMALADLYTMCGGTAVFSRSLQINNATSTTALENGRYAPNVTLEQLEFLQFSRADGSLFGESAGAALYGLKF